jgi:hypothetical protein
LILPSIYCKNFKYFDLCFNGNFGITERVCIRYTTYNITKIKSNAPIINNQVLNKILSLVCIGCNNKATIILPNIDIEIPK